MEFKSVVLSFAVAGLLIVLGENRREIRKLNRHIEELVERAKSHSDEANRFRCATDRFIADRQGWSELFVELATENGDLRSKLKLQDKVSGQDPMDE